jgi:hypothetical protein
MLWFDQMRNYQPSKCVESYKSYQLVVRSYLIKCKKWVVYFYDELQTYKKCVMQLSLFKTLYKKNVHDIRSASKWTELLCNISAYQTLFPGNYQRTWNREVEVLFIVTPYSVVVG